MKKLILISIAFMLFFASVKAQVINDTTNLVTIKDTTFANDARLNYMVGTIYPAVISFVEDYNSKVRVDGGEITKKAETRQFINKLEKAIADYQNNFMTVKDVQVDPAKVIEEFNKLNEQLTVINNDPEIKLSDAKKKVAEIQMRQAKLISYYNQIPK